MTALNRRAGLAPGPGGHPLFAVAVGQGLGGEVEEHPDLGVRMRGSAPIGQAIAGSIQTRQGDHGTFGIVIQGEVEHGLWQR